MRRISRRYGVIYSAGMIASRAVLLSAFLVPLALVIAPPGRAAGRSPQNPASLPPPVEMTAEQDHQRMIDLLHITAIRRGPSGDPKAADAANFDESKATTYTTLPDPLVLKNGKKVTSAKAWWQKRRPEIVEDFDREIYGRVPKNTPSVKWEVTSTTKDVNGDVPIVVKQLVGHVDNSSYPLITVDIQLTLTTPANATGPVPVVLEFGFAGFRPPPPQTQPDVTPPPTWQQLLLAKGWGYAIIMPVSVQADNGAGLTKGIIGLVNRGQPRKPDDWGALRAWAWGASRALDYFETDKAVNAKQVAIEGLSRYGKATIVTMAYDDRFAIAFVGSSGEGGAKILRRTFGEQVENVAGTGEYHWMAGNFIRYAGPLTPNDLPVDAHELVALCAPRPVFISSGSQQVEGGWVDAKGMFLSAVGAGPVYRLLGKKDLGATAFPPMEAALIDGDIAFRQHSGGHTTGPNWPTFLTFASRYIKAPPLAAAPPAIGTPTEALQKYLSRYAEQAAFDKANGSPNGPFGPAFQFDTKGVEFGPWIRRFIKQVKRNWIVPSEAMSVHGHVVLTFNVQKSGALTDLQVTGPSSVDTFNNAALKALTASNPTDPLPPEYPSDKAFFTVTFYYNEPVSKGP